jgi:hypothetical protein
MEMNDSQWQHVFLVVCISGLGSGVAISSPVDQAWDLVLQFHLLLTYM